MYVLLDCHSIWYMLPRLLPVYRYDLHSQKVQREASYNDKKQSSSHHNNTQRGREPVLHGVCRAPACRVNDERRGVAAFVSGCGLVVGVSTGPRAVRDMLFLSNCVRLRAISTVAAMKTSTRRATNRLNETILFQSLLASMSAKELLVL